MIGRNSLAIVLTVAVISAGCSRTHHRLRADRDSYAILHEKTDGTPWRPESDFSVYPKPHSRLYNNPCVDYPCLPNPSPQLYEYELPPVTERDPKRFRPSAETSVSADADTESIDTEELPATAPGELVPPTPDVELPSEQPPLIQPASYTRKAAAIPLLQPSNLSADQLSNAQYDDTQRDDSEAQKKADIPAEYWQKVPRECLRRMLEFQSIRLEYVQSFGEEPPPEMLDDSPRLALEDIIELTHLNSRELQTQKEALYQAALALTLERFDYQLKPSASGNGSAANFRHNRFAGITQDSLAIPTGFQFDRMLWTGGDILARFANSVILTFNGPQGFAADVGSELFFDLSQTILQRDIRLESLTQAERNVVYQARSYARFRKELFVNLASQYYSLIRQFRQIEINTQNYFTLVREFRQTQEEFLAGLAPRFQLDQIEQQVINGRRGLLSSCTSLENALDDLKIRIGLPTEQLLNLDLTELIFLTTRDELAVNAQLIDRVRSRLQVELEKEIPSRAAILSAGSVLIDRLIDWIGVRQKLGDEVEGIVVLQSEKIRWLVNAAKIRVSEAQKELNDELNDEAPSQPVVFQRRIDVVSELLPLVNLQLDLASESNSPELDQVIQNYNDMAESAQSLSQRFAELITEGRLDELPDLLADVEQVQAGLERQVFLMDRMLDSDESQLTREQQLERTVADAQELLTASSRYLTSSESDGLTAIDIDMDDAMMTALVQRFDLINERGFVGDDWRQIKYAADDLKSVLNLRATQSIRTRDGVNRPFDFSFDDSTTTVSGTFDAPFNRRQQRNTYRRSLFNYQAALRRLTQLEDNIKLSVRRDLRSISLGREQYSIDVASAALAYERVVSTELELRLGVGNVAARDFLEAQTAYISALSNVASRHIDYIVDRMQLFLDLESLTVGDDGFWYGLYDESYQPEPFFQLPGYALPAFGRLHPCLKYSKRIRYLECAPTGVAMNHRPPEDEDFGELESVEFENGDLVIIEADEPEIE